LGVRAVIAKSFERIHRSNLVMMGVLPLEFLEGEGPETIGIDGTEVFDIVVDDAFAPPQNVLVTATKGDGSKLRFEPVARADTPNDVDYLRHGGILPYVLRPMANA